jgi:hypothetical protein
MFVYQKWNKLPILYLVEEIICVQADTPIEHVGKLKRNVESTLAHVSHINIAAAGECKFSSRLCIWLGGQRSVVRKPVLTANFIVITANTTSKQACCQLHAGFLLSLQLYPEDGGDFSSETSVDFQRTMWCYITKDRTFKLRMFSTVTACLCHSLFLPLSLTYH